MDNPEHKLELAFELEKSGKLLHSLQIYTALQNLKEYRRISILRMSIIYGKLNNPASASKLLESYVEQNPSDEDIRKYFSQFLLKNGEYKKALDVLSILSPDESPDIYFPRALASYYMGDYDDARVQLKEFLFRNKNSEFLPDAYLYLAKSYLHMNKLNEALTYAKSAKDFNSTSSEIYLTIATIYYYKEMFFHARETIVQALDLRNNEPDIIKWMGKIYLQTEEFSKAEYRLNQYIEMSPKDPEAYYWLGITYARLNNNKKAEKNFNKAVTLDPDNRMYREGKKYLNNA